MSEMVERAKRAGFTALMNHLGRRWPTLEKASQAQREELDVVTRAIIAAIREPTEAMVVAHIEECAGDADEAGPDHVRKAWRAMIDAALVSPTMSQKQPD